ncbi:MmgE/PrpD family protein [Jatrophihabitans sp. DSM 45814]
MGFTRAGAADDPIQDWIVSFTRSFGASAQQDDTVLTLAAALSVDTIGVALAGLSGQPSILAARYAARQPAHSGATLLGTHIVVAPELAAFANGTAARYVEMNDIYHRAGVQGGHPSDVILPLTAIGEYAHASGRDLLAAVAIAYEIYLRFADATSIPGFDAATFASLAVSAAGAWLLGLGDASIGEAVAISVSSGNFLNVARTGQLTMWKAMATGAAGRQGVFAALLAADGAQGPTLPFVGASGWLDTIPRTALTAGQLAGREGLAIADTLLKYRPSAASTIAPAIAAERAVRGMPAPPGIERVVVHVYAKAVQRLAAYGDSAWRPLTREAADHSVPYVVAAALVDGTVTPASFAADRLTDRRLTELLSRLDVLADDEFTRAYERTPTEHRARVRVEFIDGTSMVGVCDELDAGLSAAKDRAEIDAKFAGLTADRFNADQRGHVLAQLWRAVDLEDVAEIPILLGS